MVLFFFFSVTFSTEIVNISPNFPTGSYLNEIGADGRKFSSKDFLYDKEPLQRKLFSK